MKLLLILALTLFSCNQEQSNDDNKPEPNPVPALTPIEKFKHIIINAKQFMDKGWLVSADTGRALEHSAIFFGETPCEDSQDIFNGVSNSVLDRDGAFVRKDTLPEEFQAGKEIYLDGLMTAIYGLHKRSFKCADDLPRIRELWVKHAWFMARNNLEIYPGTGIILPKWARFMWTKFSKEISVSPIIKIGVEGKKEFENMMLLDAKKRPMQITLYAKFLEDIDDTVEFETKKRFCSLSKGLSTVSDFWCGHIDISYFDKYKIDENNLNLEYLVNFSPDFI